MTSVELMGNSPVRLVKPFFSVGVLPSMVYRNVYPSGICTCIVNGSVNRRELTSGSGAASLLLA